MYAKTSLLPLNCCHNSSEVSLRQSEQGDVQSSQFASNDRPARTPNFSPLPPGSLLDESESARWSTFGTGLGMEEKGWVCDLEERAVVPLSEALRVDRERLWSFRPKVDSSLCGTFDLPFFPFDQPSINENRPGSLGIADSEKRSR